MSARVQWFRSEHPDWTIETNPLTIDNDKQFAIFQAKIFNADGRLMAMGTKKEDIKGFGDYIEKAETGSVGRALALCGYGTQFAPELDEVAGGRFADTPQGSRHGDAAQAGRYGDSSRGGQGRGQRSGHPAARPASEFTRQDEQPESSETTEAPAVSTSCASCDRTLSKSQADFSKHNYGDALCPACQRERGAAESPSPAATFATRPAQSSTRPAQSSTRPQDREFESQRRERLEREGGRA
ncbi:hypothetical protein [Capsulimonas corticalis]|uniref:hypothetical protein n=1 Tax=Capsulimonas corticalis TaxID=2219043 RepID=UPI000E64A8F8|nr:hypothetical protein [Capsulimonas corticalis]